MNKKTMVSGLVLAALCFSTAAFAAETFTGPLAGWRNVKTYYGAVGDGRSDDTISIQKALGDLIEHKDFCVLYFPAGVYRITAELQSARKNHTDGMGISMVGEDPANTIIRWDGPPDGVMMHYSAWYSKISRLTMDGAGKAGACLSYGPKFS